MKKRRPPLVFGRERTKIIKASATTISRAPRIRRFSRGSTGNGDANLTANLSGGFSTPGKSRYRISAVKSGMTGRSQNSMVCVATRCASNRIDIRMLAAIWLGILFRPSASKLQKAVRRNSRSLKWRTSVHEATVLSARRLDPFF